MAEFKFNTAKLASLTLAAIDAAVSAKAEDGFRAHLGASQIGKKCERALWYSFRWATHVTHDPRILRLFKRGQDEEQNLTDMLRNAGATVYQVDHSTGKQYTFAACGGHFGGSLDGAAIGLPDAPKKWHVVEYKTHSKKSFDALEASGVKNSKPEHWAQMQCYMHWTEMTRALYMSVCKDDDRLYLERVDYDKDEAEKLLTKAQRIINADQPPERIGDSTWFECKFCDHHAVCHTDTAPAVNCRTCAHSTPEPDGRWTCSCGTDHALVSLPVAHQKEGCDMHRYIPPMIHWADVTEANQEANWVTYKMINGGGVFTNGDRPKGYSSKEIFVCKDKMALPALMNDTFAMQMREQYGGEIVS